MKWSYLTENKTEPVEEWRISQFENDILNQRKILSNVSSRLTEIDIPDWNPIKPPEIIDQDDYRRFLLWWTQFAFMPIILMDIFRYSRLKYLERISSNICSSYEEKRILEFSFNCRHFIEVSAAYVDGVDKFIKTSENLSKSDINFSQVPINKRWDFMWDGSFGDSIHEVISNMNNVVLPTTINLQRKNSFEKNQSLKPKEGELGFNLLPQNILTVLKRFEKKIDNLHPTYDLLSEFLHPNSFLVGELVNSTETRAYLGKPNDSETFIEFFVRTDIHKTLGKITDEVLFADALLKDRISKCRKKVKYVVKSILGVTEFYKFLEENDEFYSLKCCCASNKVMKDCCAKPSDLDLKRLKKHGRNLIAKKMTDSQIEKARDLAREWMRKHQ